MSAYTDHVLVQPGGALWRLAAPLAWDIGKKGSGLTFVVPAGFASDLASVPWYARWLFNPADPRFAKASILHDAMLADPNFSRLTAAAEFAQALAADEVRVWRCVVMGLAVLVHTLRR